METYFTIEYDGELLDLELPGRKEAEAYAHEWWADRHEHEVEFMVNGQTIEDYAYIVEFYELEGNLVILDKRRVFLSFEHYHGDLKEHGTW